MINLIKEKIQTIFHIHDEALDHFIQCIRIRSFKAKHLLVKEGRTAKSLYYIIKGAARSYYIRDGKEIVIWLAMEDDLITALRSFILQSESTENIELLEDCVLAEISYKDLKMLTSKYHHISQFYISVIEEAFVDLDNQYRDLHFTNAKHKYQTLIKKYPAIIQRIPLGHIASFLGITQESLSRIRSGK
jgi:CRP-like cAMP-binding protein